MSIPSRISIAFLMLVLPAAGCATSLRGLPNPPPGTYRVHAHATYRLSDRTFLLHVPPGYRVDTPLPLVVVLHGALSTGALTEAETGFSDLADNERFLVAYPEGIGILGLLQHWNAGHCCAKAAEDEVDDVGFLAEVIAIVRGKLSVDPGRIYMAGMSNGGMLTYRFAAERGGELAAAAVVSGAIGSSGDDGKERWRLPKPERPVPVIIFHGLADETIPAAGGTRSGKRGISFRSVDNAIDFWREADGCQGTPGTELSRGGKVLRTTWNDCRDGSAVESWLLAGWGHQWPARHLTERPDIDKSLRGFDATRRIWEFFKRFRRGSATSSASPFRIPTTPATRSPTAPSLSASGRAAGNT